MVIVEMVYVCVERREPAKIPHRRLVGVGTRVKTEYPTSNPPYFTVLLTSCLENFFGDDA